MIDKEREKRDWRIPQPTFDETHALQCLAKGEANSEQQKKAIACIVHKICATHDETFHLDNERLSAWYQGQRSVGLRILKELQIDLMKEREKQNVRTSSSGTSGGRSRSKRSGTKTE
jgi:hypothetical protein